MACVVTFSRFPDEEELFLTYLEKTGDIMACTAERVPDPASEKLEPRSIRRLIQDLDPERMLIGPREFMDMAPLERFEFDGRVTYGRYFSSMPLIDYSRGVFRESNQLGESNLAFVTTRSNGDLDNLAWTPQPPAFIAWGKRVLNWTRRHAPRVVAHKRMTERVYAALKDGLQLVP